MARFVLLLVLMVGAAAADTVCREGVCLADAADADEHFALLQHKATQPRLAQVQVVPMLTKAECNVTGTWTNVACPGSSNMCMGDQCCPRTAASGDKTFPCPSASSTFSGCENNTKLATCPIKEAKLAQVEVVPMLTKAECNVTGTWTNVACPGSGNMCMGDQCCPRTAASGDKTFPCPSASSTFSGCENNTKLATCPIKEAKLAQVSKHMQ